MHVGRRADRTAIPDGFLPVFAVSTKDEADLLIERARRKGYLAYHFDPQWVGVAVELHDEQTIENLGTFSLQLAECHAEIEAEGLCHCDPSWWKRYIEELRMNEPKATHVRCLECGHDTELDEDDDAEDTPCENCVDRGEEDPYCVQAVAIIDCPNGVTASDWAPGGFVGKQCNDESHEPRTGKHVIEVES